jgi:hypothetical protein
LSTLIHQRRNFSAFCTILPAFLYGISHLENLPLRRYYIDTKR